MNKTIHWYVIYYVVNTRNISILESQLFTDFLTLEIFTTNKIVYLEEGKSRKQNLKVDDAFYTLQKKDTQELTMLARLCNQLDLKSPKCAASMI